MSDDADKLRVIAQAWNGHINDLVNAMAADLEPWQIVLLMIAAAGGVGRHSNMSVGEFLTHVREVVDHEFDTTIAGIAFAQAGDDYPVEGNA